ncbi:penicillin-binding protein 1A [Helicobacter winghamensis]|uniref:Penicillin-binding protein n=1 Tax=Helicobacter winghamensis TaxID=157268 RepID=A0A2N3PKE2_9HELI|nr:PBP1A family penicillin-binding protein [Helicobacter winghamensis]EEO25934.1 penicillin-binding protein, 1A family [Helicobacter winghamensis ATCC BAA-430]PKT76950.1 penicillin-binding protein [Helicobacter winghamensis]PKT77090.1 penicillin-binding protein [Helicobacter winghamensis]PKT77651.1 penicillin-binding protein [Helicobacter winghamensis]PKT81889.1 penicillin-binding protein [Helicobacter winghamensis]
MRTFLRILGGLGIIATIGIVIFVVQIYIEIRNDTDKIVHYKPPIATQIFDRQNRLVANLFDKEFRFYATFEEIPPRLIEALLAIEDTLFFEHPGINIDAIMRAMLKNIQNARYAEGGSTITQQLIKNVALTRDKTLERKIKEVLLAMRLETILSKEEILERYLNHTYFGHGFYGVRTASLGYFRKEMQALSLKEMAILVSLPRAPSFYDPTKNYEFALGRANNVLQRMYELGWITKEEFDAQSSERPKVYNDTLTKNIAPYVVDEVQRQLAGLEDLKTAGYKIYLNIDLDYQELAQEALYFGYEQILSRHKNDETLKEKLNGAFVVLENKTGKILALVGGVDYAKSNFSRATQSKRQIGSSVKPFLYLSAINSGVAQNYQIPDIARTYEYRVGGERKKWQPKNYGSSLSGFVSLKTALTKSLNLATINLVEEVGFDRIYNDILRYGFSNVPKDLSISLGSFGASPLEMARNFMIFSNYGKVIDPMLIDYVVDIKGDVAYFTPNEYELSKDMQSFLIVDILRNAVNVGTGRRARVDGIELAGKTGTTNDNVDAWFCGFSPSIEAIIWYGKDDNTPMGYSETGGVAPAPAFSYFFNKILEIDPGLERKFRIPQGVRSQSVDGERFYYTDDSPLKSAPRTNSDTIIF